MGRGGWLMAALCMVGCSRGAAPDAGSPELAALQRDERCAERIPASLRQSVLAGFEERTPRQLGAEWVGDPLVCTFAHPTNHAKLTVTADCRTPAKEREIEAVREHVLEQEGTEVTGVGRAAVRMKPGKALEQLTAWDDDTPCTFTVTWHGEGRDQALEVLRRLVTPEEVAAPLTDPADAGEAPMDAGEPSEIAPHLLEP